LNAQTLAALDHIKNLISNARPNATYAEAIEYLAKVGVKKLDPEIPTPTQVSVGELQGVELKRSVWQRDQGQCTYLSPGGKNC
ncbi:hypothetical protein ABK046_50205, partial [Streptomyces caeruleatus]